VDRQPVLLQVVLALRTPCRFPGLLNGWQQQGHQDADDRNHDQQLDQGKPEPRPSPNVAHEKLLTNEGTKTCPPEATDEKTDRSQKS